MSIIVSCEHCQRRVQINDARLAGQRVACPNCGQAMVVPADLAARPAAPDPRRATVPPLPPEMPAPRPNASAPTPRPSAAGTDLTAQIYGLVRQVGAGDAAVTAGMASNKDLCEDLKQELFRRIIGRRDQYGMRFRVEAGEVYEYWIEMTFSEKVGDDLFHQRSVRITINEDEHTFNAHFESNARLILPWIGVKEITDRELDQIFLFLLSLKKPKRAGGGLLTRFLGAALGVVVLLVAVPLVCLLGSMAFVLIPILVVVGPILWFIAKKMSRTYTIERARPKLTPKAYNADSYWHAILPGLGNQEQALRNHVLQRLQERRLPDTLVRMEPITVWGGYELAETRQWIKISSRRAVVLVGIFKYADDLFVSWSSYLNSTFWLKSQVKTLWPFRKMFAQTGSFFRAAGSRVAVFDYEHITTAMTEYDHADISTLSQTVHDLVSQIIKQVVEEYHIQKEISYAPVMGQRMMGGEEKHEEKAEAGSGWFAPVRNLFKRKR